MTTKEQLLNRWNVSAIEIKAACAIAFGFFVIRLGYARSVQAFLFGLGVTVAEIGSLLALDAAAKRYYAKRAAHDAQCGDIDQLETRLEAAEDECSDFPEAIESAERELAKVTRQIAQRKAGHDLDLRIAVSHAIEGYRQGIEENRVRHTGGYRSTEAV